jgi:putative aminopeptidase FrvX
MPASLTHALRRARRRAHRQPLDRQPDRRVRRARGSAASWQRRSRPAALVAAVATSQEEIGYAGGGARTIRVDTLESADRASSSTSRSRPTPPASRRRRSASTSSAVDPSSHAALRRTPVLVDRLVARSRRRRISRTRYTAAPRYTATDADAIYLTRAGVATAVISVPNRYMHSPNEMVAHRRPRRDRQAHRRVLPEPQEVRQLVALTCRRCGSSGV